MSTHSEDMELVARIVNGEDDAADEFGRQYQARFVLLARRAGVQPEDWHDVAQEALLAAISQMQRGLFRGESNLGTWLEKIVVGKIAEYWRKRAKHSVLVPIVTNAEVEEAEECGIMQDAALALRPTEQEIAMVGETLRLIPARYRVVLLLKHYEGCTIEELSRAMEMTMGQVGRRLYTAEEMFRRIYCDGAVGRKQLAADTAKEGGHSDT